MSELLELRTAQVDMGGLLKVLGNNLYSTPSVALRELVQNAHDSCTRRALEAEAPSADIRVRPDPIRGTLAIEDNGAGLTRQEVIDYLATVGRGYTGKLRDSGADEGLIGYFGLGFLSAFFVSTKVEVHTTSYQSPEEGWLFTSKGGERYQLQPAPARAVGTRVLLHLNDAFRSLADPQVTEALLMRYCCLLEHPIRLAEDSPVNRPPPPWRVPDLPPVRRTHLSMDFASRFESVFKPLCTLPVEPTSASDARGLLWIQDGATYGTNDNRNVSVFVRGMMVSDRARELLPAWAGFCSGVIESEVLVPTASREDLQKNAAFERSARHLHDSLVQGLARIAREQPSAWRRILMRHNEALLGAAICDQRLFDLLADELTVPTSEGDLPLAVVKKRGQGKIHVSLGEGGGYEEVLFRATQLPVVTGTRYGALPFSERYAEQNNCIVVRLGTRQGNAALFAAFDCSPAQQALLESLLGAPGQQIIATRFAPETLPVVLVPDREVALKKRIEADEADQRISGALLGLARMYTDRIDGACEARLYVNLDSPVIKGLLAKPSPAVAAIVRAFADLMTDRRDGSLEVDAPAALAMLSGALMELL